MVKPGAAFALAVPFVASFVLEAPRNGSSSTRPSWRFIARDVPAGRALCVSLLHGNEVTSSGCNQPDPGSEGLMNYVVGPNGEEKLAQLCPARPCWVRFVLHLFVEGWERLVLGDPSSEPLVVAFELVPGAPDFFFDEASFDEQHARGGAVDSCVFLQRSLSSTRVESMHPP